MAEIIDWKKIFTRCIESEIGSEEYCWYPDYDEILTPEEKSAANAIIEIARGKYNERMDECSKTDYGDDETSSTSTSYDNDEEENNNDEEYEGEEKMKLTEEIVKEMGFEKVENSFNPVYYVLKVNLSANSGRNLFPNRVVISQCGEGETTEWRFLAEYRGTEETVFVRSLYSVEGLVFSIMEQSFNDGDAFRKDQIRKTLGFF